MIKNVPTHDPYTGELNPYYEELTGNKNPLSYDKSIDAKLNSFNDILIELANNTKIDYDSKILSLERYLKSIK